MSTSEVDGSDKQDVRKSILSLGVVNALDMMLQVALPMLLVRLLSDIDFGVYRTLWLLVTTALCVLPMAIPASLFYFLPRSQKAERGAYLIQASGSMAIAAVLGGVAAWLWGSGLDLRDGLRLPIALFVALWVFGSLLDSLFNAMQRGSTQAPINGVFALLRFSCVAGTALVTRAIEPVLFAHLVLGAVKALTCAGCVLRQARADNGWQAVSVQRLREQWGYAMPFGASAGLYLLRARIDQWLVASMFSAAQFGLYSVAAVFSPIQGLMRSTVNNVVLPELNRLQESDDVPQMLALNRRGNLAVSMLMFPILAYLYAAASPLLSLLFTADYRGAAPIVRWYCLTLMIETIEVTTLMYAFRQGRFLMRLDAVVMLISIGGCALGARLLGLEGAALGGLGGVIIAQTVSLFRCGKLTGVGVAALQPWGLLAKLLMAAVASGTAAGLLLSWADGSGFSSLLTSGLLFVVTYWLGLRALRLSPVVREVMGVRLARLMLF